MSCEPGLKILVLGLNYAPERVGVAVYTTELAEDLCARGHQVTVLAGKPYYPEWRVAREFRGGWIRSSVESGVRVFRVAHYVPASPTGARRILHHLSFALSALLPALVLARRAKVDVVVAIAPSLLSAPVARLAAGLAGAGSWLHIQDLEIDAAFATGLAPRWPILLALGRGFERRLLSQFDRVSAISPAMCRSLGAKGVAAHKIAEFRNWAACDLVTPLALASTYRAEWSITTPRVALYSGNIATKQGLEIVVAAARRLAHRTDLTFVVCGAGPTLGDLKARAFGLPNILFRSLQPKERLSELMGLATLHLLPQRAAAADLVLPSKLTNMLASGRPVIATAALGSSLAEEVSGCGLVVPPDDDAALADAIDELIDNDDFRNKLGQEARRRAVERWDRDRILSGFERRLSALVAARRPREPLRDASQPVYQDLSRFTVPPGFRGRSGPVVLLWQIVQATLFRCSPQPFYGWRRALLRLFGASVGRNVLVRPTARITYPWNIRLGDYCWVGDHAELYSLGPIAIGAHAVVSQHSYLCAATHDAADVAFPLRTAAITVEPEAWIAADCFVAPGVTIRHGAIVAARSTVRSDIPAGTIAAGSPATVRKRRKLAAQVP